MTIYRVYAFGPDGHIVKPPEALDCDRPEEAIAQAKRLLNGHALEIWRGAELIIRLEPPSA